MTRRGETGASAPTSAATGKAPVEVPNGSFHLPIGQDAPLAPPHRHAPPCRTGAPPARRMAERIEGGAPLPAHLRGGIIALGNFDGLHLGHQEVIKRTVRIARAQGVAAIVATFDPHPARYFRPDLAPFRLTTLEQRQEWLAEADVDAMVVFAFTGALAVVTPRKFVDEWLRDIGGVVTGENFAFGRGKAGSTEVLASLCGTRGLSCEAVRPVLTADAPVSSTRIRAALRHGDCSEAARLLTRPFAIAGILRPGQYREPALPLLPATLDLGDFLRPRAGVYAVRAKLADGRLLGGSAYLAESCGAVGQPGLELFLVDLSERDFGCGIEVQLIAHLHDAREQYDPAALRRKIETDRAAAQSLVSSLLH